MRIGEDIMGKFFSGIRTDTVPFVINDSVRVISGTHAGRIGTVVSIVTLEPEVIFLIEPGHPPWGDIEVSKGSLEDLE